MDGAVENTIQKEGQGWNVTELKLM